MIDLLRFSKIVPCGLIIALETVSYWVVDDGPLLRVLVGLAVVVSWLPEDKVAN